MSRGACGQTHRYTMTAGTPRDPSLCTCVSTDTHTHVHSEAFMDDGETPRLRCSHPDSPTQRHTQTLADRHKQAQMLTNISRQTPRPPHPGRPAHKPRRAHVRTFAGTQTPLHRLAVPPAQARTEPGPIPISSVSTATQTERALE